MITSEASPGEAHYWGDELNRCTITTPKGEKQLLSVPIYGSRKQQAYRDIRICYMHAWQHQHWAALYSAYGKTPYWEYYADYIKPIYEEKPEYLWQLNERTEYILACLINNTPPSGPFPPPQAEYPFPKTHAERAKGKGILDLLMEYGPALPVT